jgi:hypothetical protein
MPKRVLLVTRDLMFRAKLREVILAAGGTAASDAATCDLAVVEIDARDWELRIRELAPRVPVLAFGSHVHADALRAARDAGAVAVPNSQVAATLARLIAEPLRDAKPER